MELCPCKAPTVQQLLAGMHSFGRLNKPVNLIAGVPTTILDEFPVLKEYRNNIAKIDFVASYYADVTEGPRATYKADV